MKKSIISLLIIASLTISGCSLMPKEKPVVTDMFTAIEDYHYFFMNYADSNQENKVDLKTKKPKNLVYVKDLTEENSRNLGEQHVWAKDGWNKKPVEEMQLFYFQSLTPQETGSKDMTEEWYGPFQGKLGLLMQ